MSLASLAPLILSNTLFLSIGTPTRLEIKSQNLWFSKKGILKAENSGSSLILVAKKAGHLHSSGLLGSKVSRVIALKNQDYKAVKKCGIQYLDLSSYPLKWNNGTPDLKYIENCGFKTLSLKVSSEDKFNTAEIFLMKRGIKIKSTYWNDMGQKELQIQGNKNQIDSRVKKILGPLKVFYNLNYTNNVKPGETIIFKITLFEFFRDKAEKLGVKWPSSVSASITSGLRSLSFVPNKVTADFGESSGISKVLAQPSLRALPGEEALFQSGGEIPIKNFSERHQNTEWKKYGLIVKLKPNKKTQIGDQEIDLNFDVEFSEPNLSLVVGDTPAFNTRKLSSKFALRAGETTVLSSMIRVRKSNSQVGIWGLSQIPLLNLFLSSSREDENSSELYFAIEASWSEIPIKSLVKNIKSIKQ